MIKKSNHSIPKKIGWRNRFDLVTLASLYQNNCKFRMQRSLSNIALLFVSVSAMIGSGWLFGPLYAAQIAGPYAIFSWALGGFLVMVVALTFSEVSAMLPLTGGIARFPQFSHGPMVSYVMTWVAWIAYVLLPPIEVQALVQYTANFFPHLVHMVNGKPVLSAYGYSFSFCALLAMSLLNIIGINIVAKFNNVLCWFKIIIPLITAYVFLVYCFHPQNFTFNTEHAGQNLHNLFTTLPMAGVVFSFFGFRLAIELAGEAKNPQTAMPLALMGSIVLCIVLYTVGQVAFIGAIPSDLLQNGWAKLSFSGEAGPIVGIALLLGLNWLVVLLYINAVLAPFGSALMVVTSTARLDYAMRVNGYAPKWLQKVNKKHAPYYAILLNFVAGCVMLFPFPGWQALASFILAGLIFSHAITPICLAAMRYQVPDQPRPFRVPAFKFVCYLAFTILNFISYWTGWDIMWKMALVAIVGIIVLPIFRLFQDEQDKPKLYISNALWLIPYFIGMLFISYGGTFGGGCGFIPFGWDMLLIAVFSVVIFFLGLHARLSPELTHQQITHENEIFPFAKHAPYESDDPITADDPLI